MSKHTPGPWHYDGDVIRNADGDWLINGDREGSLAGSDSDLRLAASAPDLLEALRVMTAHYCNLVRSGDAGSWEPDAETEVQIARAAIAKATGGQP